MNIAHWQEFDGRRNGIETVIKATGSGSPVHHLLPEKTADEFFIDVEPTRGNQRVESREDPLIFIFGGVFRNDLQFLTILSSRSPQNGRKKLADTIGFNIDRHEIVLRAKVSYLYTQLCGFILFLQKVPIEGHMLDIMNPYMA